LRGLIDVEQELASGHDRSRDELIEQAVRHFFDERQRGRERLDALRRIGQAVDQAGVYERVMQMHLMVRPWKGC
jgi:predicted transcriptional regulator